MILNIILGNLTRSQPHTSLDNVDKEISINDIQKNRRKILVPKELEKVFDKETSAEWSKVKLPVKRKVDKTFLPATDDKVTTGEDVSKFAKALSALCELYSR